MNLAIDIGNTHTKLGFFEGHVLIKSVMLEQNNLENFILETKDYIERIKYVIISSVKDVQKDFTHYVNSNFDFIYFKSSTPLPIINMYHSPLSIGMDRLAAVIGAQVFYKNKNILVIDAGTCITYDFINSNMEYLGGSISPGIRIRFRALNNYTDKLPLVQTIEINNMIGRDTLESIKSGVLFGIIAEMNAVIEEYHRLYSDLKVMITGGDSSVLAIHLKNSIFAAPQIVLIGLNEVLIYNKNHTFYND